jgi:hypothetical protein
VPVSRVGASARAESTSSRLFKDLDPGNSTAAFSGPVATGANQGSACDGE